MLTGEQIRDGWLAHKYMMSAIRRSKMRQVRAKISYGCQISAPTTSCWKGWCRPATNDPKLNEHYDMIDAQLSFGSLVAGAPPLQHEVVGALI